MSQATFANFITTTFANYLRTKTYPTNQEERKLNSIKLVSNKTVTNA